jgi:ATP-binding protein involved in chromosome partitioning
MADAGTPIVLAAPDSHEAAAYRAIAARIWAKVEAPAAAGPRIVME